jgi:hypothetical protein
MKDIDIILIIVLLFAIHCSVTRENYDAACRECGGRIVTAQVFANPDYTAGLGWL